MNMIISFMIMKWNWYQQAFVDESDDCICEDEHMIVRNSILIEYDHSHCNNEVKLLE
jgi:hypothetical protein